MLNRLLAEIGAARGSTHPADLARRLGADVALVQAMLEQLARMGYIEDVSPACAQGCERCGATCASCGPAAPIHLRRLTPAGLRALAGAALDEPPAPPR